MEQQRNNNKLSNSELLSKYYKKLSDSNKERNAEKRSIITKLSRKTYPKTDNYKQLFLQETELFNINSLEYKLLKSNKIELVYDLLLMSKDDIINLRHINALDPSKRYSMIETLQGLSDMINIIFTDKELEELYIRNKEISKIYINKKDSNIDSKTFPFNIDLDSMIIYHYFKEAKSILPSIVVIEDNKPKFISLYRLGFTKEELEYANIPYFKSLEKFIETNLNNISKNENSENKELLKTFENKLELLNNYTRKYQYNNPETKSPIKILSLVINK